MNWIEVLDPVCGLQQDDWILHGGADGGPPVFGEQGQLKVVGWSGRNKTVKGAKYYIQECSICKQDGELFGDGVFRSLKGDIVGLQLPCGCSRIPKWSQEQWGILATRKAVKLGYVFNGFVGEWKGQKTKISMTCPKHGEWCTGNLNDMINKGVGCPRCKVDLSTKPDDVMISSFFASGSFHPCTKFWRSERRSSKGTASYWYMSCPECGETGESFCGSLQTGSRPCGCSKHSQQQAYINWIVDDSNNAVGIKFGIARDSEQRVKQQDSKSIYEIRQYQVYTFPDVASCKKAERECKEELICGVVSKTDMKDGWTETTCTSNIARVKSIFERNGGVLNVDKR